VIPLKLAKLSPTKDTGRVFGWLAQDGTKVRTGQAVVEIEMGRVTMEVESPADGTIRIVAQRGATVPVGGTLAEILSDQEVAAAAEAEHAPEPQPEAPPAPEPEPAAADAAPANLSEAERARREVVAGPTTAAMPAAVEPPEEAPPPAAAPPPAPEPPPPPPPPPPEPAPPPPPPPAPEPPPPPPPPPPPAPAPPPPPPAPPPPPPAPAAEPAAAEPAPPAAVHVGGELAAEGVMDAHKKASRQWQGKTTLVDLFVLAVAQALGDVPELNGTVGGSSAGTVDLALSLPGPDGTVWPVLRGAGTKDLQSLAAERQRLSEAAKSGSLGEGDTADATASLWNLGAYPVDLHVPAEVGPQIVRVTVGRVLEKAISFQRMLTVRPRVWISLAIDGRAADGEAGGRFLSALQKRLNDLPDAI